MVDKVLDSIYKLQLMEETDPISSVIKSRRQV